jgi:hypothetical protein
VRRAALLLLLLVVLALELQHFGGHRSHPDARPPAVESAAQARAERLLTRLDFRNQQLMPYILLEHSQARALKKPRLVRGLTRLHGLWTDAAREPMLRATGVAWARWTAAILSRRHVSAGRLASLEAKAARLDQTAYVAIGALLRAALKQD